jgi:hypothetical protein
VANIGQVTRRPHFSCFDIYGNQLTVSRGKKGKVNFTLYHGEVVEGTARREFADLSLRITEESGQIFQMMRGFYEVNGSSYVTSADPIRDGRNFIFIERENDEVFNMTIGRDLANVLNRPNSTNIELSGEKYEELLKELGLEENKPPVKRIGLSQ